MSKDEILFRFVGPKDANGKPIEHLPGIPTRNLTATDVDRVKRRGLFDDLKNASIYKAAAKPEKPAKADKPADDDTNAPAADAAKEG